MRRLVLLPLLLVSASGWSTAPTAASAPQLATKYTLDLATYPAARCLDGSPGAYYIRTPPPPSPLSPSSPSSPSSPPPRFYIYQEGGGFCTSLDDCLSRSNTSLGSSLPRFWPTRGNLTQWAPFMGFDADPHRNPLLHDTTQVRRCEGTSENLWSWCV